VSEIRNREGASFCITPSAVTPDSFFSYSTVFANIGRYFNHIVVSVTIIHILFRAKKMCPVYAICLSVNPVIKLNCRKMNTEELCLIWSGYSEMSTWTSKRMMGG
jgi:hypothetical protein